MKLNLNEINYILCETIKLLTEITVQKAYQNYYSYIDEDVYTYILSLIQPNQKNILHQDTKWVLGLYQNNPEIIHDLPRLVNDEGTGILQIYNRLKVLNIIEGRDKNLYNFKTIDELENLTSQFNPDELWGNNDERKKRVLRSDAIEAKNEVDLIYEDNTWIVLIPKTYEASVYWGHGTSWCTAYKDDKKYYNEYTSDGPLYININIRTGEKYQFHFETSSFKDKNDNDIEGDNLFDAIKASKGMVNVYKSILPKEIFNTLITPYNVVYENDYFEVVTQYRLFYNDSIFWDLEYRFDTPPLKLIYKDGSELNVDDGTVCDGFSHFYCLNDGKYLIGIVNSDGDAYFHILTLNDIMQKHITEFSGEFYGSDYSGTIVATNGTISDMISNHPEIKDIIKRIDKHLFLL